MNGRELSDLAQEAIGAAAVNTPAAAPGVNLRDLFSARAADVKRAALAAHESRLGRRLRDAALWAALTAGVIFFILLLIRPGFIYAQDDDFSSPQVSLSRTTLVALGAGVIACCTTCYLAP